MLGHHARFFVCVPALLRLYCLYPREIANGCHGQGEYHLYELVYDPRNAQDANAAEHGIDCSRCTVRRAGPSASAGFDGLCSSQAGLSSGP